ncbi:MAG: hypothetical protein AYK19_13990 [Theionarchaea archaeon DG-70-1]|nr:MAG: hypothetical protein AYK19_13990 [Theionarchaea archaeon DG-70-1]
MTKINKSHIHLTLSHILNDDPDIALDDIRAKVPEIKSRIIVQDTLVYMEEQQILMNPRLLIRNCEGYTNYYMIARVKSWDDLYRNVICRNYEFIDSALYIRSWEGNRLAYLKYHNELQKEVDDVLEEGPLEYYEVIYPQCITDEKIENIGEPDEKSKIPADKLDKRFDWDYDTKQVFEWLSINYRLNLTRIGKLLDISRTTAKRKKDLVKEFVHVHYPTYIQSLYSYTGVLSSFHTEYPGFVKGIFRNLSATSYLLGNQKRTLCHINTTLPGYVIRVFEKLEAKAIIEDLNVEIPVKNWNRIQEEYKLGRIPEKLFWMFKRKKRKRIELPGSSFT